MLLPAILASGLLSCGLLSCSAGLDPCPAGSTRQSDGLCHLDDDGADGGSADGGSADGGSADGGADGGEGGCPDAGLAHGVGDPLLLAGQDQAAMFMEYLDASPISATRGILVANNGYVFVDLDSGVIVDEVSWRTGFRVSWDPTVDRAYIATRWDDLVRLDVSEPDAVIRDAQARPWTGYHEDISAFGGLLAVAVQEEGLWILDDDLGVVGQLPLDYAYGVGMVDDRAVVTDGAEAVLVDLSDPGDPRELDRVSLGATGVDVAFDGVQVGVALGGAGVAVLEVVDDQLLPVATLTTPEAAYGVSLDDEHLWVAAWGQTVLVWLGEGGPTVIGHEAMAQYAIGIGAVGGGRALVADWQRSTLVQRVDDVAAPELVVDDRLSFATSAGQRLVVGNQGVGELIVGLVAPPGWTVSETELQICPGEERTVIVTPPDSLSPSKLALTSNDPDEAAIEIELAVASSTLGEAHPDFTLSGFTWPDPVTSPYTLSHHSGEIVYLAWFSPT